MSKDLNNIVKVHQYGIKRQQPSTQAKQHVVIQIEGAVGPNEETDTDRVWSDQSLTKPDPMDINICDQLENSLKHTQSTPNLSGASQSDYNLPKRATLSLSHLAADPMPKNLKPSCLKCATSTQTIEIFRHKPTSALYRIARHSNRQQKAKIAKKNVIPTHTVLIQLPSEQSITALRRPSLSERIWDIFNNPTFFLFALSDSFGYVFIMAFLLSYLVVTFSETRQVEIERINKMHSLN